MKKAILTAIASGTFILALVFSTNTSTVTFGEQAFADGTCCSELTSTCIIDGIKVEDSYKKDSGSCFEVVTPVEPIGVRPIDIAGGVATTAER
ncbi:MAG: hypothetical protein AAF611_01365 [Bacteroidota bacterium]